MVNNKERKLIVNSDPKSPISESYRNIRTNIQFANLDNNIKIIMVSSSMQGEGKTTTISNIAVTFANQGKKVLVIDCDLRKPKVHQIFKISNSKGISDALLEGSDYKKYVYKDVVENLDVLTCGHRPSNPAEVISSNRMKTMIKTFREDYDYVFIDTPPVSIVTDGSILSTLCDGVILVCASGAVDREIAQRAKSNLDRVNANILGVVLNKFSLQDNKSYYYYSYSYDDEGTLVDNNSKNNKKKFDMTKISKLLKFAK